MQKKKLYPRVSLSKSTGRIYKWPKDVFKKWGPDRLQDTHQLTHLAARFISAFRSDPGQPHPLRLWPDFDECNACLFHGTDRHCRYASGGCARGAMHSCWMPRSWSDVHPTPCPTDQTQSLLNAFLEALNNQQEASCAS